ncbi:MAG TPA: glycosyltransferase [Polyangiaceae bacterium]|jgi:glycosyltransferase involved in cell wall biosynthesis
MAALTTDGSVTGPARAVRVLFINDTARNGGPGRSLHALLRFVDPSLVHRTVVLPRDGEVAELLRRDGVIDRLVLEPDLVENPIEPWDRPMTRADFTAPAALRAARFSANVFKVTRGLARLSSLVRRDGIDLVYCNGTNANFAGGALARITGVPALWHVRYTSIPRLVDGVHRRLSASRGVRRIVCVSAASAGLFAHCADKVAVVHNGLDVDAFSAERVQGTLRAELGFGPEVVVFGSHGRVLRRKGYVEMLRAARLAIDRLGAARRASLAFVVVGDTPEDFATDHVLECRALAAELGIADRVHLLGFRPDVRPLVVDFDVAVVPSVYADPLPRAVIESMALGRPVLAFDVGGVREMLSDGEAGALLPFARSESEGASAASVDVLAAAFVTYAGDRALRERQGAAARLRVEREFDARVHARRIEREIVRASGTRSKPA